MNYTGARESAQESATSKRDNFTRDQFDWLRQVAFDSGLPPAASRVAAALTQYFSRKHDGWAWMAQATIARDLGMPERTVRFALSALNERGHLVSKRRGKMETNLYHLALKSSEGDRQSVADHDRQPIAAHDRQPIATHTGVTGRNQPGDRQKPVKVTGNPLPPNPLSEPTEGRVSPRLDLDEEDSGRRSRNPSAETETDAGFESWYQQFPKHVAQAAALKAYRAVVAKKLATPAELLAGAMRYAAERSREDPRYTKHPRTWLAGGCWSDEPALIGGTHSSQPESPHIAIAEQIARQLMERDGGYVQ
jgi:hypothetical protein